ncbi:arf-GAP with Rho-GAP domain, ANK repeat and PH domain-containing protein 2 isoform X2 [Hemibagrus wyckioides]|uniref:arf-GAP with Rho-GAP domain, ANK repeat and PH domain-containing protein 2 isoform X2 n=1 Tax=Hemibagrus wyckioides TaxID=337641 RepID=UPI00266CF563|nr:arf-GAP with Rho-GAP domain, ANK repeat and PH domain-containing protein 2 isoform X2 [Hemibagrus wyckioides]
MTSEGSDGSPPSSPLDPSNEISLWLSRLHLLQYATSFTQAGYYTLADCRDLTEEKLLQVAHFPTGHRRRILHNLELLKAGDCDIEGSEMGGVKKKPVPFPRTIFLKDGRRVTSSQNLRTNNTGDNNRLTGTQTLPARTCRKTSLQHDPDIISTVSHTLPRTNHKAPLSNSRSPTMASSNESLSLSSHSLPSDWENFFKDLNSSTLSITQPVSGETDDGCSVGFQGVMVDNDIYESSQFMDSGPRSTRSYKLRHRPVPEIPECTIPLLDCVSVKAGMEQHSSKDDPSGGSRQRAPLHGTLKSEDISPYGEIYLYDAIAENKQVVDTKETLNRDTNEKLEQKKLRKQQAKQQEKVTESSSKRLSDDYALLQPCGPSQEPAKACSLSTAKSLPQPALPLPGATSQVDSGSVCCEPLDALSRLAQHTLPLHCQSSISPYACFYGRPKQPTKMGWLDKLSPQGNRVFQRRWVKFDGENLTYYNNDKEMYSKGLVSLLAVKQVRSVGDNKFEVVTSMRTFVFRVEKEGERQEWLAVLQAALKSGSSVSHMPCKLRSSKSGYVELRGHKGKVYLSLTGTKIRLCKTDQDFNIGLAITVVDLTAACVKHMDRKGFEINTPFKSFCFTAESDRERKEWIEAVQESIVETLSNYEVAEKIWFNQSNRSCADCHDANPEWASINLVVVICKMCAGQHRFLGSGISQVRSLKLDSSIWTNELVELFLEVGNENANKFWAANLPPEEELHKGASPEHRAIFHCRKYKERKYRKVLEGLKSQEELNKALCSAVLQPDVLFTMALVFSGADVMCATGDPDYSTPYLLAQKGGQRLQMEFLYHNQLSEFAKLEMVGDSRSSVNFSSFMDGFLYCSVNMLRSTLDKKCRDDMIQRWCTLEGGYLSYYDGEKSATPIGRVDISEMVSLAINNTETMTGAGAVFTFEIYLESEKMLLFGTQTSDAQKAWVHAITKCLDPERADSLLKKDYDLIGRLYYKEGHDLYHWRQGWFSLVGSELFLHPEDKHISDVVLQLKRLQELTVSTHSDGDDRIQVLLMVESGRTIYIHGFCKQDFTLWHSAIQSAAGRDGTALSNQQLTKNDIPIIIDSCISFVTQYGLCHQGIYQKNGDPKRVAQLLGEFTRDARNVKLRVQDHQLEDVTDVLKGFLSNCEDALLPKELYPYWISALDEVSEKDRVEKYSTYIQSLPKINRSTLAALLQHLYRIQSCSHINQMKTQSLACVFSSCLFQTGGHAPQETRVVEDLINNYIQLFSVNKEQVKQMERENRCIMRWKDTTFSPAGDLIFEVYLEKKEPEHCCLIKVSPTVCADELTDITLEMKGIKADQYDFWTTFEVIETGELERPLHYKEKILEQVLEWSTLEDPSSAFLLIKKFHGSKMSRSNLVLQKDFTKEEQLKFKDGSSKLLSGNKFQDKYFVLRDKKLLLYKDTKSAKPEREVPVESVKCYSGIRKKLKPTSNWGFTVYTQKQQWYFCCEGKDSQLDWVTAIIRSKYQGDLWPTCKEKSKSSDQQCSREHASARLGSVIEAAKHSMEENKMVPYNVTSDKMTLKNSNEAEHLHRMPVLESCFKPKIQKRNSIQGPILASSGGNYPPSRDKMAVEGSLQTLCRPVPHPDSDNHTRPQLKKAMIGCSTVQLPQSLLSELSSVLSQTGRIPRQEN